MKNLFSVLVILMVFLASCSGTSGSSQSNETHTHSDGTVHSSCDDPGHDHQHAPQGQESFKAEGAEAQHGDEEHQHTEECEEHGHRH